MLIAADECVVRESRGGRPLSPSVCAVMLRSGVSGAVALLALSACGSSTGSGTATDIQGSTPEIVVTASMGACDLTAAQTAASGRNAIETVASLYPDDEVLVGENTSAAEGYAVVLVARDGKVIAQVGLHQDGDFWSVDCVMEGNFSPEYYPVPE
jgi:hypothetical protein